MSRVVLVTGVSRDLAARVTRSLAGARGLEVIGIDVAPPSHDLGDARYVRVDLRSPLLTRSLAEMAPDTVVHAALTDGLGAAAGKEQNVLASLQLLATCQALTSLRQFVLLGSGAVYGSSAGDPARFAEDAPLPVRGRSSLGRDAAEVETHLRAFGARRSDVTTTVLRCAEVLGAGVDSKLARYIALPVVPRPLGFDARLQFLHPIDAVDACRHAVIERVRGIHNVAAEDVIGMSQVLRILGRPGVGVPQAMLPAAIEIAERAPFRRAESRTVTPMGRGDLRAVTYGRAMDVSRFKAQGFTAHYTSRRAVDEFAAFGTPGLFSSANVEKATRVLDGLGTLARRVRGRSGPTPPGAAR